MGQIAIVRNPTRSHEKGDVSVYLCTLSYPIPSHPIRPPSSELRRKCLWTTRIITTNHHSRTITHFSKVHNSEACEWKSSRLNCFGGPRDTSIGGDLRMLICERSYQHSLAQDTVVLVGFSSRPIAALHVYSRFNTSDTRETHHDSRDGLVNGCKELVHCQWYGHEVEIGTSLNLSHLVQNKGRYLLVYGIYTG